MNPMMYVLTIIFVMILYFLLSPLFKTVGNIAIKMIKAFKNNIVD